MGRINRIAAVISMAAACAAAVGCADRSVRQAADTADSFIKAYFSADYAKAASLCGESLKSKVEESAEQIEALPDSLKSAFLELAAETEPHLSEVYEMGSDSVMVDFDILVPEEIEPMRNSVLVVKNSETGVWTVEEIR